MDVMKHNAVNRIGQVYGRLTVRELVPKKDGSRKLVWLCDCECGGTKEVVSSELSLGRVRSCGCLIRETASTSHTTHGKSKTRIYYVWYSMMKRCYNETRPGFEHYGGRGIKVCDAWQSFENFYRDMGDQPEGLSLDRIDNDRDYCPENCRWATKKQQCENRSITRWIEFRGERDTLAGWARKLGITGTALGVRIRKTGVEAALTKQGVGRWAKANSL
jgi:hypothetical protein